MEMFAMALGLSLLGVGVSAALFLAATRDVRDETADPPAEPERRFVVDAPHFFARPVTVTTARGPVTGAVPIDMLLMQLERHVQLEQAAAESFHEDPTAESLHIRTLSPLVH